MTMKRLLPRPSISKLPPAKSYASYTKFIERIELAMQGKKRILIYGDYDADGILQQAS